jgi:cytochrome P450 family 135
MPLQTLRLITKPVPYLEACRERYGGTFTAHIARSGRIVFISDPPSLKALFGADRINMIAPGRNILLEPLLGPRSVLLTEDDEHLSRRKMMLPPFHGERMRAYTDVMAEATEREVATWPLGRPFPLHPGMQAITLEVIMRAVFGVAEERLAPLRGSLGSILAATTSPLTLALSISTSERLGVFPKTRQAIAETDEILRAEIAAHRAAGGLDERTDILAMLMSARDEKGEGMDDEELRDQLLTLLTAGHETTATALAWTFDLLFRHPEAMARLREEVEAGETEYLDAVIEEALRLRPVIPFVGRELRQDSELGGYELPSGTPVFPGIYLTHTDENVFPDPYAFRPERFLDSPPETYSWIPFGGGTRRCIGATFAQFEMRVVLSSVLRSVALRGAVSEPEQIIRRNVTLSPKNGTPAIVDHRLTREPEPVSAVTAGAPSPT